MHNYSEQVGVDYLRDRIRELEETTVAQELVIAQILDELDEACGRERRMLWTAMAFGTLMMVAIVVATWPGR